MSTNVKKSADPTLNTFSAGKESNVYDRRPLVLWIQFLTTIVVKRHMFHRKGRRFQIYVHDIQLVKIGRSLNYLLKNGCEAWKVGIMIISNDDLVGNHVNFTPNVTISCWDTDIPDKTRVNRI